MKRYLIAFLLYICTFIAAFHASPLSWMEFDYTDRDGKERHAIAHFFMPHPLPPSKAEASSYWAMTEVLP